MATPIIEAHKLMKRFGRGRGRSGSPIQALDNVSVEVNAGRILGLVGESGSGKSTLGRILVGIEKPDSGFVQHRGIEVADEGQWKQVRRDIQYIFQDAYGSLPDHMTVRSIVRDPLDIHRIGSPSERESKVERVVELVGLRRQDLDNYPGVFSGGQRQRISIARALILEPSVVVCDEIVSGLDVSVQAQVLNLVLNLHEELGVGYLFISHDLRVVRYLCDEVAVMFQGKIVEQGSVDEVYNQTAHDYTRRLLKSIPGE